MTRSEKKLRLTFELGCLLSKPKTLLFDNPAPTAVQLAVVQTHFIAERDVWLDESVLDFITIKGVRLQSFYFSIRQQLRFIDILLVSGAEVGSKREQFKLYEQKLLSLIGEIPADDADVMVPAGSSFDAYRRLLAICSTTTRRVHLFDPFLHARTFLLYFADLPDTVELKVVTDGSIMLPGTERRKEHRRDKIVAVSELLSIDRPTNYSFLMAASIHDRHLRADDKIYHLGGSVADASLKDYYSITQTDSNASLHATLDTEASGATPWFTPGMAKHRRWCQTCSAVSDVKPNGNCQACNNPT